MRRGGCRSAAAFRPAPAVPQTTSRRARVSARDCGELLPETPGPLAYRPRRQRFYGLLRRGPTGGFGRAVRSRGDYARGVAVVGYTPLPPVREIACLRSDDLASAFFQLPAGLLDLA